MPDTGKTPAVAAATERADRIRAGLRKWTELVEDIKAAFAARDWDALGYSSWDSYVAGEFGQFLPRFGSGDERRQIVMDLSDAGLSTRAIAAATGTSKSSVSRTTQEETTADHRERAVAQARAKTLTYIEHYRTANDGATPSFNEIADALQIPVSIIREAVPAGTPEPKTATTAAKKLAAKPAAAKTTHSTGTDGKKYTRPEPAKPAAAKPKARRTSLDRAVGDLFDAMDNVSMCYFQQVNHPHLRGQTVMGWEPKRGHQDVTRFNTEVMSKYHRDKAMRLVVFLTNAGLLDNQAHREMLRSIEGAVLGHIQATGETPSVKEIAEALKLSDEGMLEKDWVSLAKLERRIPPPRDEEPSSSGEETGQPKGA